MTDSNNFDSNICDNSTSDRAMAPENSDDGKRFRRFLLDPKATVKNYVNDSLAENNNPVHGGQNYNYNNQQGAQQQYLTSNPSYPQQTPPRPNSAPLDQPGNFAQRPYHLESHQGTFEMPIHPNPQDYQAGPTQPPNNGFASYPSSQNDSHYSGFQQQDTAYGASFSQPSNVPEIYPSQHQEISSGASQANSSGPGLQTLPFPHPPTPFSPSPQPSPQIPHAYPAQQTVQMPSSQGSLTPPHDKTTIPQSRYGPAPPPADSVNSSVLAPRIYHRMILDFETLVSVFYTAKARKSSFPLPKLTPPS